MFSICELSWIQQQRHIAKILQSWDTCGLNLDIWGYFSVFQGQIKRNIVTPCICLVKHPVFWCRLIWCYDGVGWYNYPMVMWTWKYNEGPMLIIIAPGQSKNNAINTGLCHHHQNPHWISGYQRRYDTYCLQSLVQWWEFRKNYWKYCFGGKSGHQCCYAKKRISHHSLNFIPY